MYPSQITLRKSSGITLKCIAAQHDTKKARHGVSRRVFELFPSRKPCRMAAIDPSRPGHLLPRQNIVNDESFNSDRSLYITDPRVVQPAQMSLKDHSLPFLLQRTRGIWRLPKLGAEWGICSTDIRLPPLPPGTSFRDIYHVRHTLLGMRLQAV